MSVARVGGEEDKTSNNTGFSAPILVDLVSPSCRRRICGKPRKALHMSSSGRHVIRNRRFLGRSAPWSVRTANISFLDTSFPPTSKPSMMTRSGPVQMASREGARMNSSNCVLTTRVFRRLVSFFTMLPRLSLNRAFLSARSRAIVVNRFV